MPRPLRSLNPSRDPVEVRFVRACQGLLRSTTYQGSICLAFAGAVTLVAMMARLPTPQFPVVFLAAMAVPLPFVKYFNTPTRIAGREIKKLKAMARQDLITPAECKRCEKIVMRWLESQIPASLSRRSGSKPPLNPPTETTTPAKVDRRKRPPRH